MAGVEKFKVIADRKDGILTLPQMQKSVVHLIHAIVHALLIQTQIRNFM
jgi:hypothetical protein